MSIMIMMTMRCARWLVVASFGLIAVNAIGAQEVISRTTHELVHQGLTVLEVRTLDPMSGTIERRTRTLDGHPVDLDDLVRREQGRRLAALGKMSPDLNARVARASPPDAPIETALWLRIPEAPDFRLVLEGALARGLTGEDARSVARDTAEHFFRPYTRALASRLAAEGCRVVYTGTCWPIVIVEIPANEIAGVAADPRVDMAYHSAPRWMPENHFAQPTLRSPTAHARGITGKNSTLKVMVNESNHVTTSCPYLPPVTWLNSAPDFLNHPTAVAGNICSKHPTYHGVARELPQLFSVVGDGDAGAPPAWNLAIKNGVSFGNCSWWNGKLGKIEFLDRFFDYTIRQFGVMMFKSAGNQGFWPYQTPYITTPGNGYNVIATGCYNEGDTADWRDDVFAYYSSYLNPAEGHDKPEVIAPGDGITTTANRSPWIVSSFSGTSSASPMTCGTAALLATRDPNLRTRTYTLKAILMASAWHNVEGNPVLSDKDGAGGIHAGAADAVVRDRQFVDGTLTAASFPGGRKDVPISLNAGDETRVIALWFSNPDNAYSTDVLDMDLDLVVLDPMSRVVAASASTKNPFEIVAFVPGMTGTYTVRLVLQRFKAASEPFAVAWSTRQDMATAEVKLVGSGGIGTTLTVNFIDQYHPGATYRGAASFATLPGRVPLPEGHIVPLAPDALFRVSILGVFPGFSGSLDASGKATGTLAIPNAPVLKGIDIHLAMASFRAGSGGALVKGTSPAATFQIK